MSLTEIRDIRTSGERPHQLRYLVQTSQTINPDRIVGIHVSGANKGQVREYDPSISTLRPLGLSLDDAKTGDGSTYCAVSRDPYLVTRVTVGGATSSDPGDPVFADSAATNPADLDSLSVTQEGHAVAHLHEQVDGESWIILLAPPEKADDAAAFPAAVPAVTAYTADGAITLPTEDGEAARLTGGASAAMTLAVPTAGIVGMRFTIYRSAGAGTHDVDYTDEAGNAQTRTFADGEAVTLLAASTTGWRPLS